MIEHYSLSVKNKVLLNDTTLTFEKGKINHLLGKNGVGKSQLAKDFLLDKSKQFQSLHGEVTVIGSFSNLPQEITISDLDFFDLDWTLFNILGVDSISKTTCLSQLSDGQKQKLKLWFFLSNSRDFIVFDEITNAIDKKTTREIYLFLNEFNQLNPQKTIINITHNLSDLVNMEGNYYLLDDQKITQVSSREIAVDYYMEA